MSNREAWCADKLSKLLIEDLRISTLSEIKDHFSNITQDEAYQFANIMQLPLVFDCLNDNKTEQIELACDVLSLCMNSLTLGESTSRYGPSLTKALEHPIPLVKLMALKEIHRTAKDTQSLRHLSKDIVLLVAIAECVGDEELVVAQQAAQILQLVGNCPEGLRGLLVKEVRAVFERHLQKSDIIRFRVYEILINIASHSEENLQYVLSTGLIDSLLSTLDSDDILLKLNVIEILSHLAMCSHGLNYLENKKIIDVLQKKLASSSDDPLGQLEIPGLLSFFGKVAHWKPEEIYEKYPMSFQILLDIIKSNNFAILAVALDTLGHIGVTAAGKKTLAKLGKSMDEILDQLGGSLSQLTTELRVRALECIYCLVRVLPQDQEDSTSTVLTQAWFQKLHSEPLTLCLKYAQNPFLDMRLAGLNILQALSQQHWGQQAIRDFPGLIEFLLDRRIETSKESKELKYEIIKSLNGSCVFSEDISSRLQQYVMEGPFYVQTVTEIAIEDAR